MPAVTAAVGATSDFDLWHRELVGLRTQPQGFFNNSAAEMTVTMAAGVSDSTAPPPTSPPRRAAAS